MCALWRCGGHVPEATAVYAYKAENIMCRSVGTIQSKERGAAPGPTAGAPPTEYYPSPANAALTFGCARKYWLSFIPAGGASSEMPNWELRCTPRIKSIQSYEYDGLKLKYAFLVYHKPSLLSSFNYENGSIYAANH